MDNTLLQQCAYNAWANKRLGILLLAIDSKILDTETPSSFNTIRKTIHHIWDAELIWMARLKNVDLAWPPSNAYTNPSIADFAKTSQDFFEFAQTLTSEFLESSLSYKNTKGESYTNKKSGIIMHCMNHSTFHRGQVITMLRALGITDLKSTDLITYLREMK
ncbi:MAG: hypothetical protein J0M08_11730 [Bacteroidetes bacterium]|nr:hypothetical protein [Bacteroidota bacterium]